MVCVAFVTAALIIVLSVFNGLEVLLGSLYTSFDPELKIESVKGKSFDFYSVKSKFILLEFWSSHCLPCRAQNPNWKKLYTQYHQKGLEIVGISLDTNHSEWKDAIKNDGLPWINVSDLLGFNNIVAQKFLIDFIPVNILLDEDYSIISFNVSPSDLEKIVDKKILN